MKLFAHHTRAMYRLRSWIEDILTVRFNFNVSDRVLFFEVSLLTLGGHVQLSRVYQYVDVRFGPWRVGGYNCRS